MDILAPLLSFHQLYCKDCLAWLCCDHEWTCFIFRFTMRWKTDGRRELVNVIWLLFFIQYSPDTFPLNSWAHYKTHHEKINHLSVLTKAKTQLAPFLKGQLKKNSAIGSVSSIDISRVNVQPLTPTPTLTISFNSPSMIVLDPLGDVRRKCEVDVEEKTRSSHWVKSSLQPLLWASLDFHL